MGNLTVFLMCMTLFVVTLSRDIHARYADNDDGAFLEAFVRAVAEGKIDINNLVQDKSGDLNKRWWWTPTSQNKWFSKFGPNGKK